MGILITALLLLTASGALAILRVFRPRFRFSWLLALAASLAAALSALTIRMQLPSGLDLPLWRSNNSSATFATFTILDTTWPFMLGVVIVVAALLLTAPGRPRFPAPATWSISLMLAGLGVLVLAADSPLTLILIWAALDLTEAGLLLARLEVPAGNTHVLYAFAMRLGSIGLLMLAFVLGEASSAGAKFVEMGSSASEWLLPFAAILRLGSFALPWPRSTTDVPDDLGTMLQLTAGAASVAYLSQVQATVGSLWLLALCGLVTLYAGWMFLRAEDLQQARPLWIMGVGSLSVAAALSGNPVGAAGWGFAILLAGGPLFINSLRGEWAQRPLLLVLWILSGLPFSLTASAWSLSMGSWILVLPLFLMGQALLLAGSFHQALRPRAGAAMRVEVLAVQGIQYASVGVPLVVGILLGLFGWPGAMQIGSPLAALLVMLLTAGLVLAKRRLHILNPPSAEWFPKWSTIAATSIRREGERFAGSLQGFAAAITRTMEGEAGILWGLLFLVLFISLIAGGRR